MLTHGMSNTRIYNVWSGMIQRCENPNHKSYARYGGRGIEVCDEWHDFEQFEKWAYLNGYADDLTIDRKDNNGNYTPENCKWSTAKQQANNRRTSRLLTYNGETHTVAEWGDILGINPDRIHNRINSGWNEENAVITPIAHGKGAKPIIDSNGRTYESIAKAAETNRISHSRISMVCSGKSKTAGGLHWRFINA